MSCGAFHGTLVIIGSRRQQCADRWRIVLWSRYDDFHISIKLIITHYERDYVLEEPKIAGNHAYDSLHDLVRYIGGCFKLDKLVLDK